MEYEARGKRTVTGDDPSEILIPIPSMYGINFYVWLIFVVNVGKFSIHGCYGICKAVPKNSEFHPSSLFVSAIYRGETTPSITSRSPFCGWFQFIFIFHPAN